jgi:hypothetical protein
MEGKAPCDPHHRDWSSKTHIGGCTNAQLHTLLLAPGFPPVLPLGEPLYPPFLRVGANILLLFGLGSALACIDSGLTLCMVAR